MRRFLLVGVTVVLAASTVSASALGQATTFTTVSTIPIAGVTTTDCPATEPIAFNGTFRTIFHYTLDASGVAHLSAESSSQATAVGLVSGTRYVIAGASASASSTGQGAGPFQSTFTNTFLVVSAGGGSNLRLRVTLHVTVNAGGVLTAEVEKTSFGCVG
jgi:hypothetical protein